MGVTNALKNASCLAELYTFKQAASKLGSSYIAPSIGYVS
jgi:hypothetical protein